MEWSGFLSLPPASAHAEFAKQSRAMRPIIRTEVKGLSESHNLLLSPQHSALLPKRILMPTSASFSLFLTAAIVLAITPGPGIFYVLTRSIKGGRREGYTSALGTAVGGLCHVVAAAFGLSAILATSALAFEIVKYIGAAYLIYLGIRTLLSKEPPFELNGDVQARQGRTNFFQGILTEVLNPKTALFFLAFIPQFINTDVAVVPQFIILGCITVCLNTSVDFVVATAAGQIAMQLKQHAQLRQAQRLLTGAGLMALGVYVALSGGEKQ